MTAQLDTFSQNDERHRIARERGRRVTVFARTLISMDDDRRICEEGQNAADEIARRILAETGKDPEIKIRYLDPSHDLHDEAYLSFG